MMWLLHIFGWLGGGGALHAAMYAYSEDGRTPVLSPSGGIQ
jgi:hypothetical protein